MRNVGQIQVQLPSAGQHPPLATAASTPSPTALSVTSPEGIDCYGNERQALTDQAKFFNNSLLSDVILVVGGNRYFAHKLILVRSSDVFQRMLSDQWKDSQLKVCLKRNVGNWKVHKHAVIKFSWIIDPVY